MTETAIHSSLCIICNNNSRLEQAGLFAGKHKLPLHPEKNNNYLLQLVFGETAIELYDMELNTSIHVDFVSGALAYRQLYGGGRGQALAKAIGLKHGKTPHVLDVTAGLARDAYILASLGCSVTLVEQSPVLACLISDGIKRSLLAEENTALLDTRFEFHNMDAVEYMRNITDHNRPDVIYMDPMYPERKKSALVKKDMQILKHLLGEDNNAEILLKHALSSARKRVVVKRPIHAKSVTGLKPDTGISSKKTRYDIYLAGK